MSDVSQKSLAFIVSLSHNELIEWIPIIIWSNTTSGIILYMRPGNERRCYIVTPYLIGWAHTQNDPCNICDNGLYMHQPCCQEWTMSNCMMWTDKGTEGQVVKKVKHKVNTSVWTTWWLCAVSLIITLSIFCKLFRHPITNLWRSDMGCLFLLHYIDRLMQERLNSSVLAMELHLSCINQSHRYIFVIIVLCRLPFYVRTYCYEMRNFVLLAMV